ncbi:MAG TPA: MFS transporter [Streptosporangiaceae bacterium]
MKRTRPWVVLVVLCLGTFAILLDTTIVNVALPSLVTGLHASLDQALWVVNGYLLVFCALLIVASRLGDVFGPRRMFVAGLAVFAVASALCGAAQNPGELIAARVVQGLGAAALSPQAMVIIQQVFPRDRMGAAFGVYSSLVGLAAVSGPTVGGVLTTYLSWRWVFYVNLPIAVIAIVLALRLVPEVRTGRRHSLDLPGVLLSTTGLAAVVYGLIEGQRYNWGTVAGGVIGGVVGIPEILGVGVLLLAGFVWWERRSGSGSPASGSGPGAGPGEPLVPLGLFRDRTFAIMTLLNIVVQFALQSMLLINSINLQSVLGFSAVHAGLTGLPLTIALTAVAPFAGRLTDRIGGKFVLLAGLAVYGAGIATVALVSSVHATSLTFAPALLVAGLGMGAIFAPLATMAMRAAPPRLAGAASGVLNTGRQFGATLGGSVSGAVLAAQLATATHTRALAAARVLPASTRPGFVSGFARVVEVGRGQQTASIPRGTPPRLVPLIRHLISDVFDNGYIAAMRPTLSIPVGLLLGGAALCLALPRLPRLGGSVEDRSVAGRSEGGRSAEDRSVEDRSVEGRSEGGRSAEDRSVEDRSVEGRSEGGRSEEDRSVEGRGGAETAVAVDTGPADVETDPIR